MTVELESTTDLESNARNKLVLVRDYYFFQLENKSDHERDPFLDLLKYLHFIVNNIGNCENCLSKI